MSETQIAGSSAVNGIDKATKVVLGVALTGVASQFVLPMWRIPADDDWGIAAESLSRSDVSLLLGVEGSSALPLYAGILGFVLCAAILLFVPRQKSWRGPLAGVAALISLYLPVGLAMSADANLGEVFTYFHIGLWLVIVAPVLSMIFGVRIRTR